jgi:putative transposase
MGESFRCLTVKDEAPRLCLAIEVDRSLSHERVIVVLTRLLARYGRPRYIRSANGPEVVAQALQTFLNDHGIQPSRIEPGKPWQNGSNESCNGPLRRECLEAEQFRSVTAARVVIEDWRRYYSRLTFN